MVHNIIPGTAFLDIETTGLSPASSVITMVGVLKENGFHCLVAGQGLSGPRLRALLADVEVVYTYNGARFDLRFILEHLGVDIKAMDGLEHVDLMYVCRRRGLTGGQKKIEECLDIARDTRGMTGYHAARLGRRWLEEGDEEALGVLVHYNEEDVTNLSRIEEYVRLMEEDEEADDEGGEVKKEAKVGKAEGKSKAGEGKAEGKAKKPKSEGKEANIAGKTKGKKTKRTRAP